MMVYENIISFIKNQMKQKMHIPVDVPSSLKSTYQNIYSQITHDSGKLMLFAGDQKIEHMNKDFYGEGIAKEDNDPVHLFNIANKGKIGVFATQLGLIAQYGCDYPKIPYLVKLNSKTNLVKTAQKDPLSTSMMSMDAILRFKKSSGLSICGIGYTIYLGSEYEHVMLHEAAKYVFEAHQNGMISVLWIYPRGKAVLDEKDPHVIAGAAGVAATLGSDFVKVNSPKKEGFDSAELLKEAVVAAGRTKLVCAGGSGTDVESFLKKLHNQIHVAGAMGNATGRNIHQKPLEEAVRFCNAIYAITVENKSVADALKIYQSK